ncbi:MAG TPA: glycosyltransferase family 39 protein, partial [Roseiflexaceae bacterium]
MPLILLLALALRLLLWSQPLHQLANDEVEYVAVARDLLAGRGWQFYEHYHWLRAPLYPLFLAASLWLAGGDLHRAALPNIALSVATVYLSYRLARAQVGRRAGARGGAPLLAALFSALLWPLATFASLYMSETLFTFLFTAALLCLVRTTDDGRRTTDEATLQVAGRKLQGTASPRHLVTLSPCHLVTSLWWAAATGVLFGLATLTRSIALLFLPVVALWLLLRRRTTNDDGLQSADRRSQVADQRIASHDRPVTPSPRRPHRLASVVFVLAAALAIAPWTIRNYAAYGRIIPVETGLSYNLWAFNEPRERQSTIFRTLEGIPNPAERSDYATAKGLARLREDPAILLRKLWPNWIYLWRVKPIEDRFLQESYYGDVGLPLFAAALVFDDALYLVIALAGVAGLALYRRTTNAQRSNVQTFKRCSRMAADRLAALRHRHDAADARRGALPPVSVPGADPLCRVGAHAHCRLQIADCRLEGSSTIYNLQSTICNLVSWSPGLRSVGADRRRGAGLLSLG